MVVTAAVHDATIISASVERVASSPLPAREDYPTNREKDFRPRAA